MSLQETITHKIREALPVEHLEVVNESYQHNVPEGSESHFKVTVVSDKFAGMNLLSRHRAVNAILAEELSHRIHALALHTYTADEWQERSQTAPQSPPCRGGSKTGNG